MPFLPPNQQRQSTEGTSGQSTGHCLPATNNGLAYIAALLSHDRFMAQDQFLVCFIISPYK